MSSCSYVCYVIHVIHFALTSVTCFCMNVFLISFCFVSIHRGKLMKILRAYGIPAHIVQSISDVYDNTSAKVLTPDGETDTFPILAGVLQGDTLCPLPLHLSS